MWRFGGTRRSLGGGGQVGRVRDHPVHLVGFPQDELLEESQQPGSPDTGTPVDAAPPPRRGRVRKVFVRLLGLLLAVVVGLLVTGFTIDLGPHVKDIAEKQGSNYLKRPMHIGRLSARLRLGLFVVEDLVIEGLEPQSRPFLKAKKITRGVSMVDCLHAQADHRVGDDDGLGDGPRDLSVLGRVSQWPAQPAETDARA